MGWCKLVPLDKINMRQRNKQVTCGKQEYQQPFVNLFSHFYKYTNFVLKELIQLQILYCVPDQQSSETVIKANNRAGHGEQISICPYGNHVRIFSRNICDRCHELALVIFVCRGNYNPFGICDDSHLYISFLYLSINVKIYLIVPLKHFCP